MIKLQHIINLYEVLEQFVCVCQRGVLSRRRYKIWPNFMTTGRTCVHALESHFLNTSSVTFISCSNFVLPHVVLHRNRAQLPCLILKFSPNLMDPRGQLLPWSCDVLLRWLYSLSFPPFSFSSIHCPLLNRLIHQSFIYCSTPLQVYVPNLYFKTLSGWARHSSYDYKPCVAWGNSVYMSQVYR